MFLEGHLSIQAAIEAKSRDIHDLLIAESKRYRAAATRTETTRRGCRHPGVSYVSDDQIEPTLPMAVLMAGWWPALASGDSWRWYDLLAPGQAAFIVMLDGIEDPYNFGWRCPRRLRRGRSWHRAPPTELVAAQALSWAGRVPARLNGCR